MVPRLGITVSEVRIIPVEYSDVMLMAPITAIISWPSSKKAISDAWVASVPGLFCGLLWMLFAMPNPAMAAMPTLTMIRAARVQQVERTERSLVNSEATPPHSPAGPGAAGSGGRLTSAVVVVIGQPPLPIIVPAGTMIGSGV